MTDQTGNGAAAPQANAQIALQKIYVKDASFEAPSAPQIFSEESQSQLQLNMAQKVANIGENVYEVVLTVTLTCTVGEKTAYLAEVHQAGIFGLAGFDQRTLEAVLGTYCPNVLFPYARQMISDLVQNGGFPPYFLQPINFEQLYAEQMRRRAEQGQPSIADAPTQGNA
ncbi:protein-export chaperone SecB [Pseudomarimonas arenosa]|uniref:Protein-export protein SecB n=1 Tax=Pseudomarimonas arenosa TaxID=2774145 RepID=A0AAW3ZNG7_9GAMM|nr:protein-export chaperone SecB [Pseudomarimonas arenosa]MBD8527045.1 protein-export chaperone SecB [Pseudomarimonas arenosa]